VATAQTGGGTGFRSVGALHQEALSRANQASNLAFCAFRTDLDGVFGHVLEDFEWVSASVTFVFVSWQCVFSLPLLNNNDRLDTGAKSIGLYCAGVYGKRPRHSRLSLTRFVMKCIVLSLPFGNGGIDY